MRSFIEVLESRIAPASVVNVAYTPATGKLDITSGDPAGMDEAHAVHVFPTGPNSFRVEAQGTTTIGPGGAFFQDFTGKLTTVNYTGGDADDTFTINNFKSIATLTFDGKDGVDKLQVTDVTTTGLVTVKFGTQTAGTDQSSAFFSGIAMTIGGDVVADYGPGGGFLDFNALTTTVKGGLKLTGGVGEDELYVVGNVATISKGINFLGGVGDDYISIQGGSSVTVGKAADGRALFFDGGEDADTLEIFGDGVVSLQGKVQFDGGAGDNGFSVGADALNITGDLIQNGGDDDDFANVQPLAMKVGGDWKMNLGNGGNFAQISALTLTASKTLSFQGGTGTDSFSLGGNNISVANRLELTLGDAPSGSGNEVQIFSRALKVGSLAPLLPALSITGAAGDDRIAVSPLTLTVNGAASINLGDGSNTLDVTPEFGTFAKDVLIVGGTNDDLVGFGGDTMMLKANLTFILGAGENELEIDSGSIMTVTKDLKVTTLGGGDDVSIDAGIWKVMGIADFNLGDGSNEVDAFMTNALFSKTVTYTGGTGKDDFSIGGTVLTVKGAVDLKLSEDENTVDLYSAITTLSSTVNMTGGDGANNITFGNRDTFTDARILSIAKATTITLGSGGNRVILDAPQSSFGAVTVTSTGGTDLVNFNGTKLSASGLVKFDLGDGTGTVNLNSSAVALKAGLTILGGVDADGVSVFADGTITGDVTIDLGGATDLDQSIYLTGQSGLPGNLKITGALSLSSAATDIGMNGNKDSITVYDVTVTKAINVNTGAVDSEIDLNNVNTSSTLSVSSGAGNDLVQLETFSTFGAMTVAKATSILLGDGDDTLTVGFAGDTNNQVRFLGNVTVDKGPAGDMETLSDLMVNFFGPGVTTTITP